MSEIEEYVLERLRILDDLEIGAASAERAFYHLARQEISSYTTVNSTTDSESVQAIQLKLGASHDMLQHLNYELDQEIFGDAWHAWAKAEREIVGRRIERLTAQIHVSGAKYVPKILSTKEIEESDKINAIKIRIDELQNLLGLNEAWIERRQEEVEGDAYISALRGQLIEATASLGDMASN